MRLRLQTLQVPEVQPRKIDLQLPTLLLLLNHPLPHAMRDSRQQLDQVVNSAYLIDGPDLDRCELQDRQVMFQFQHARQASLAQW